MYQKLEKGLVTLSVLLIIFMSMFIVIAKHKQMYAGNDGCVLVLNANMDIKESISRIAKQKHVLIAKQIMVPTIDGKTDNQPTFQKFGQGKLPSDFPQQRDKRYIENSSDTVYYFIFGKGLDSNTLANDLNQLGNKTVIPDNDWCFQGITMMLNLRLVIGTVLFVVSYMALLMAEVIGRLKKHGVQRLAGISPIGIAFSGIRNRLSYLVFISGFGVLISMLVLYVLNLRRLMYIYVVLFPALFWIMVLAAVELVVGLVVYLFLKKQKINLVIKDRIPITALMNFVFILQLLALICLIFFFFNHAILDKRCGLANASKKRMDNT